jgi:hypothetical protein
MAGMVMKEASECLHEPVCKHKSDPDFCINLEICKFSMPDPYEPIARPRGRRGHKPKPESIVHIRTDPHGVDRTNLKGSKKAKYNLTTSLADVRKARAVLKSREKDGALSEDDLAALNVYKGKHVKSLSDPERQQIIDILKRNSDKG